MWKVVEACVRGTSHIATGKPCQDAIEMRRIESPDGPGLVIAIADGAGSAKYSDVGSRTIVQFLSAAAEARASDFKTLKREDVLAWFEGARRHLEECVSAETGCNPEGLASTALVAIVWREGGIFAQVGDGAWVVQTPEGLAHATWPYTGEYANQTKFVTSGDAAGHLAFESRTGPLLAVAGFTDGIQSLALNFAARKVHQPFFQRLLEPLRGSADAESLSANMAVFLDSPPVNQRTDDDKTLVLACWQEPASPPNEPAR
ncbi:MAG: PP2C family serine/threonine-protein phosphatase [Chthoniobacteraceae bacterium]